MKSDISPIVPPKKLPSTKAWKLTSLYVRLLACGGSRKGNKEGKCYTCPAIVPIKKMHAGHFNEKQGNAAIYFDLTGLRGQCYRCNRLLHGNKDVFAANLIKESGPEVILSLQKKCQQSKVWRKNELEMIAEAMEYKIGQLV